MGLGLFWKPPGIGSQEFLKSLRSQLDLGKPKRGKSEIGHTGTLDPFAEGLLCVGWGEGTKLLAPLVGAKKKYIAEIVLGATTNTLDSTSEILYPTSNLLEIQNQLNKFFLSADLRLEFLKSAEGEKLQIPPEFSAIKIDGKRAYDIARKGEFAQFELKESLKKKERPVTVYKASELSIRKESVDSGHETIVWEIEVLVSSGTYIRALARDYGQQLFGYPGYLRNLKRTGLAEWSRTSDQTREAPAKLVLTEMEKIFHVFFINEKVSTEIKNYGRFSELNISSLQNKKPILLVEENTKSPVAWLESVSPLKSVGFFFRTLSNRLILLRGAVVLW